MLGGGLGSDDDTVERASARKAPRKRKCMRAGYIEGGLVGCVSLVFDQRRHVVEPEGSLGSGRAEIDVLEIDSACII